MHKANGCERGRKKKKKKSFAGRRSFLKPDVQGWGPHTSCRSLSLAVIGTLWHENTHIRRCHEDLPHWNSHLILTGTVYLSAVPLSPPLPLALLKPACICVISDAIWSPSRFSSLRLELLACESKGSKAFAFACDHYWQTFKYMKTSAHLL